MTRQDAIKFVAIRSLGNFLLLFSLYGVVMTFGPAIFYEVQFRTIQARGIDYIVEDVDPVPDSGEATSGSPSFGQILTGETKQVLSAVNTEFSIQIPKIAANARVIPNVDPASEEAFKPALMKGIAHAKGTVFPGIPGNTYLFAHSTDNWWNVGRYNAVFYLLKELKEGDDITVFFQHKRYDYTVMKTQIEDPSFVDYLKYAQTGPEQLVLQTCWPPGTTWKRLYVIAEPKASFPQP